MKLINRLFFTSFLTLFCLMGAAAPSSLAAAQSPWTTAPTYRDKVMQKFDFGVMNFLVGWTAVISQTSKDYKPQSSPSQRIMTLFPSLGKGLVLGAAKTGGGLLHIVTAPIPLDIPLPEGGVDVKEITGGKLIKGARPELSAAPFARERTEKQSEPAAL